MKFTALVGAAIALAAMLTGCVIAPYPERRSSYGHHHHHHHHADRAHGLRSRR